MGGKVFEDISLPGEIAEVKDLAQVFSLRSIVAGCDTVVVVDDDDDDDDDERERERYIYIYIHPALP